MKSFKSLFASWDAPTVASMVAFFVMLAAYCVADAAGLVVHDGIGATPIVVAAFVIALAALAVRPYLAARFETPLRRAKPVMLAMLVLLAFYLLERPYNPDLFDIGPSYVLANLFIIAALFATVYLACQQTKTSAIAFLTLCFLAGTANSFVIAFKGQPVLPADLFALGTAAAVGGGYTYAVNDSIALAFTALALSIVLVFYLPKTKFAAKRGFANAAAALVCACSFGIWFSHFDIEQAYGVQVEGWAASDSYARQGSILCFLKRAQDLSPAEPQGYSPDAAAEILLPYQDADQSGGYGIEGEFPAVIAIMNETYSDLSRYPNLAGIYEGLSYFDSIDDAYLKGTAYASALGAGTCNSEFEFLTGTSMASLGDGTYPYMLYDLNGTENLATYFKALGYETCAIHPADAANWRRDTVYSQLGFDEFLDIASFDGADTLRGFTTDKATYEVILERLSNNSAPQFIFDVTLQNHGGYDTGLIPDDMAVSIPLDADRTAELEEYAASVRRSENDLRYLIEELSALGRPVVVCIFGDHQPGFSDWLASLAFGKDPSGFTLEEAQANYEVPYMIWTNFESPEPPEPGTVTLVGENGSVSPSGEEPGEIDFLLSDLEEPLRPSDPVMSLNYLGAHMVTAAQLPATAYHRFLFDTQQTLPAVNINGYLDPQGTWHKLDEHGEKAADGAAEALGRLAIVQYDLLFGT